MGLATLLNRFIHFNTIIKAIYPCKLQKRETSIFQSFKVVAILQKNRKNKLMN